MYLTVRITASDTGYFYTEKIKIETEFSSGEIQSEDIDADIIELFSRIVAKKTSSAINEYLAEEQKLNTKEDEEST